MKQVFFFSFVILFYSCNLSAEKNQAGIKVSNTKTETAPAATQDPVDATKPDGNEVNSGIGDGACTRLIFFQPGSVIESVSTDAKGKEVSRQATRIISVTEKDGFTVANAEATDTEAGGKGKVTQVAYNYKCDGKNIYFDIASMFRTEKKNNEVGFESTVIPFPISVKAGEELPDASGVMSSQRGGRKMTMTYTFKDRKVAALEEVTTAAGTWKCYKINQTVEVEMDIPGMDERAKEMMNKMKESMKMTSSTWLSPEFGVVKTEIYRNGELQSKNEVVSVKR